jgi:hypothetical protein
MLMENMAHAIHTGAVSNEEFNTHRVTTLAQLTDAGARIKKRLRQKARESVNRANGMLDVTHMGMSAACQLWSWSECRAAMERDIDDLESGLISTADLLTVSATLEFEGAATLASLTASLRQSDMDISPFLYTLIMKYLPVAVFTTALPRKLACDRHDQLIGRPYQFNETSWGPGE